MKKQLLFVFAVLGVQSTQPSCVAMALVMGKDVKKVDTIDGIPTMSVAHVPTGTSYVMPVNGTVITVEGIEGASGSDVSIRRAKGKYTVYFPTCGKYKLMQGALNENGKMMDARIQRVHVKDMEKSMKKSRKSKNS